MLTFSQILFKSFPHLYFLAPTLKYLWQVFNKHWNTWPPITHILYVLPHLMLQATLQGDIVIIPIWQMTETEAQTTEIISSLT